MNKEQLKRIFEFLEGKEQQNAPFKWKLLNNEPLTDEELNFKGNLNFFYTKLESLPEGLKVGGWLDLSYTPIISLPDDLYVGRNLYLRETKIASLPKGLKVGGWLDLSYTPIISLPEGLEVGGDLYIKVTNLTKYTNNKLREMIKPGFIKGKIFRK
jgi:hypothetical protein